MVQGTPQFTPTQVLDAGRRAEAEGKIDYAIQFYRHLTDHYSFTPEAAGAREALARIGVSRGSGPPPPQIGWRGSVNGEGQKAQARAQRRARPAVEETRSEQYRVGRAIAHIFTGLGWVVFALGLAATGLAAALWGGLTAMPRGQPFEAVAAVGFVPGLAAMLTGLAVVLGGQLSRAVFDMADGRS